MSRARNKALSLQSIPHLGLPSFPFSFLFLLSYVGGLHAGRVSSFQTLLPTSFFDVVALQLFGNSMPLSAVS